ncbi:unnamed protein product [Diatraea saccharalis]|uniref:FAD-dependent oxidoreductase domain-containing protein 1 n=1 Tax=Diatraea saccharalis TaxID=40085 RepID=A0A9P0BYX0_9NEOP|nr:unnamed protein product [Diatraea saccharalis]
MYSPKLFHSTLITNRILTGVRSYAKSKNPFVKSWETIANEIPVLFGAKDKPIYPENVDVVVIGGGFIGSSVAYWLKSRTAEGLSVVVLEKDLTYRDLQNNSSLGTLSQHFSLPENIYLSQFSAEFLRKIKQHLGNNANIKYQPHKNLILACEKYAETMEKNVTLQAEYGIQNKLITPNNIKQRYPWLNTHDIKLGCVGTESEGIFDAQALLGAFVNKAHELGSTYINAEVVGFDLEKQRDVLMEGVPPGSFERINKVIYRTPDNEEYSIKFAVCVLAAGDDSGSIARLANIGTAEGLLSVPLPIEKRKSKVYSLKDKAKDTGLNTPIISDTSGLWLQRNGLGNNLICGHIPIVTEDTKDLSEKDYYSSIIKPSVLNRISNCENTEVTELTTEKQDCNTFDYSGIIGPHPYHNNLYIATGFGKQGCQNAPAIGRAISELIIDGRYTSIDLTRFDFDRLLTNNPLVEFNIY